MTYPITTQGLSHLYGDHAALRDLNLQLGPGIIGLVGINGAGKSTLMRILSTALAPTAGMCGVFGVDSRRATGAVRRRVGYMPQSMSIPRELRAEEFLAYMSWARGFDKASRDTLVSEALEAADLTAEARLRVGQLSGGMLRRLLLGQALLGSPDFLLLDEPTAGLDPEQRVRVRELIAAAPPGRTTLVSSHQMEDLAPIADRIVMLDAGQVVFDGALPEWRALGEGLVSEGSGISALEAAFLRLRGTATS